MDEPPVATAFDEVPLRPRMRGVLHQYAFFVAVVLRAVLVVGAAPRRPPGAAGVYPFAVCGLLGTSALSPRIPWRPRARAWMRRLDHSMIFVLIAGTYTP